MTELTIKQDVALACVDRAINLADSTKRKYRRALERYLATGASLTDAEALADYAQVQGTSGRAFLKAAVRLVTEGLEIHLKGQVTPELVHLTQAALWRLESVNKAIKVKNGQGQKAHTWLSQLEARRLFAMLGEGLVGQRDRVILALLVGAGLRRSEVVALTFADVLLQPVGDRMRTVLDIKGKGKKARVVPVSDDLAAILADWRAVVGDGRVARSLGMSKEIGESLSGVAVHHIVRKRARAIGFDGDRRPELAPHDLRRTYAQLGYEAGVPLPQISKLLGHSTVAVTQRYLNLELDLETTVSDFIPLG